MVTTSQLANELQNRLNNFAGTLNGRNYKFIIRTNASDYEHSTGGSQKQLATLLINGLLIEQTSTPIPLKGLDSVLLLQTLNILIPSDTTGAKQNRIEYAMNALNAFVSDVAGNAGNLSDSSKNNYAYILSVSTPYVGQETIESEIGLCVPVSLQVSWQLIKDGVLANNVTMKMKAKGSSANPTVVVLMDGAIVRTRTGDSSNVDGSEEMKTEVTQQGLTIKVVMPYKRGDVSEMLFKDMLTGALQRVYELSYTDGDGNTVQGVSASWDVVAREITASLTSGKGITVSATLEIAR